MGKNRKNQQKTLIKKTMKFASIIAIAAAFALTAEAQRNGGAGGRGGGGRGGRGGRGRIARIARRFRNSEGALVGCKATDDDGDGPIGFGIMHQVEGEATFVRSVWKDIDFYEGFDEPDFDPRTFDVDV